MALAGDSELVWHWNSERHRTHQQQAQIKTRAFCACLTVTVQSIGRAFLHQTRSTLADPLSLSKLVHSYQLMDYGWDNERYAFLLSFHHG